LGLGQRQRRQQHSRLQSLRGLGFIGQFFHRCGKSLGQLSIEDPYQQYNTSNHASDKQDLEQELQDYHRDERLYEELHDRANVDGSERSRPPSQACKSG
jgi:hypothetical protein